MVLAGHYLKLFARLRALRDASESASILPSKHDIDSAEDQRELSLRDTPDMLSKKSSVDRHDLGHVRNRVLREARTAGNK